MSKITLASFILAIEFVVFIICVICWQITKQNEYVYLAFINGALWCVGLDQVMKSIRGNYD